LGRCDPLSPPPTSLGAVLGIGEDKQSARIDALTAVMGESTGGMCSTAKNLRFVPVVASLHA